MNFLTNKLYEKGSSKDFNQLQLSLQFRRLSEHTYFTKYSSRPLVKPKQRHTTNVLIIIKLSRQFPQRKIVHRLRLGFGLVSGLWLGLVAILLGGNCPRTASKYQIQKSNTIVFSALLCLYTSSMCVLAWNSVERVHKPPELPKAIVKLESSVEHDLGNIQNATPRMHLINRPLLYRKDNSCGLSSNVCPDDKFFHQEVLFLRKELDNKQKTTDNLLNIINYMPRNSNESGSNFYKNTNGDPVQINATAWERFQTQKRNNLKVKINTNKDITLNQTQSEGLWNGETQQHRDIKNRSVNTIENQFIEFCQKQQEKLTQIKKPHISPN